MSDQSIEDIFDVCVDRLAKGQALDTILADYPKETAQLRPLLEMGELIRQAQAGRDEVQHAQRQTRARLGDLLDDLDEKPKRQRGLPAWLPMIAAAMLALVCGVSSGGVFTSLFTMSSSATFDTVPAPLVAINSTVVDGTGATDIAVSGLLTTATYLVSDATRISLPTTVATASGTPLPTGTPLAIVTAIPSMMPLGTVAPLMTATVAFSAETSTSFNLVVTSVYGLTPSVGDSVICSGRDCPATPVVEISFPTPVATFTPINPNTMQVQSIRAGEIDDNADWDTYLTYRRNYESENSASSYLPLDLSNRFLITVRDQNGKPLFGARVQMYVNDGNQEVLVVSQVTYADGRTQIIANPPKLLSAQTVRVVISYEGRQTEYQDLPLESLRRADLIFGLQGN